MTALFPTAYLPSVYYMACLSHYDSIAIEVKETFPKQTYRNRAVIATGNGLQVLTVPVIRPNGNHTRTEQMGISYQEPWHIRHWRAIVSAYSAAPFFLYYRDGLEKILLQPHEHLVDLNDALLQYLLKKLKIKCEITYTQDYLPVPTTTTPKTLSSQIPTPNTIPTASQNPTPNTPPETIIPNPSPDYRTTLCAKHAQPSVSLPPYSQVFDTRLGFQPNLTVLDLLFNLGPESPQYLKAVYSV